jgi:hypothetical protein
MLRKTNYKRDSLRRSFENGSQEDDNYPVIRGSDMVNNNANVNVKPSGGGVKPSANRNSVHNKKQPAPQPDENANQKKTKSQLFRKDSLENIKMMVTASKDFSMKPTLTESNENDNNSYRSIKEELVPGLLIEGHLTDL